MTSKCSNVKIDTVPLLRKYAWITFALLTLGFFFGGALGMKKTGLSLGGLAIDSLIVIILIPAMRHGELNLKGCVFYRYESPLTFNIMFCLCTLLGIAVTAIYIWMILAWDI